MKYSIQIKVFFEKEEKIITNYVSLFDIPNDLTALDFKNAIKNSLVNFNNYQTIKQSLYSKNKEFNDTDLITQTSGLKYNLILKKN